MQPIDLRTLSTQVYIVVAAITTLFLSALVIERERSAAELAEAQQREEERAMKASERRAPTSRTFCASSVSTREHKQRCGP
jgi:hypothetical protein